MLSIYLLRHSLELDHFFKIVQMLDNLPKRPFIVFQPIPLLPIQSPYHEIIVTKAVRLDEMGQRNLPGRDPGARIPNLSARCHWTGIEASREAGYPLTGQIPPASASDNIQSAENSR